MTWQPPKGFKPGLVFRPPDPRDVPFGKVIEALGADMTPVVWRPYDRRNHAVFPIEDQGSSGSCVAQATSKLKQILDYYDTGRLDALSASFIYSRIALPEGGAYAYKGPSTLVNIGTPLDSFSPDYDNGNPPSELFMRKIINTPGALQSAEIRKVKSYAAIAPNIEDFAKALSMNKAIVFGAVGTNQGWTQSNDIVRPPKSGEEIWGHFVCGIDWTIIDGKKAIVFINSWSDQWGDAGFGYITEDYFKAGQVFSGYTVMDIPNALLEQTKMKRVIRFADKSDQYIVEGIRIYRIPDLATLQFLRDEVKVLTPGDPEVIPQSQAVSFLRGRDVPSVEVARKISELYPALRDAMEPDSQ